MKGSKYDAVVVGSGPNGLAAAITFALAGHQTILFEEKETIGGGMRSAELTLPHFTHDICSAIHPLGISSPFFRSLPLSQYGLKWIQPLAPLAHPFDDGCVLLERSIESTAKNLGIDDKAYKELMVPLVESWDLLASDILGPLKWPQHPLKMASFGLKGLRSANGLAKSWFKGEKARGLFAGLAAHSMLPLDKIITASYGLILGILGHAVGWPLPEGGSQSLANALGAYFTSLGGEIVTGVKVNTLADLPVAKAILFDLTPKQLLKIVGDTFPQGFREKLESYRYGPGVFKIDWALNSPIPWKSEECLKAGTVHLGGTIEEITRSENEVWEGKHPEKPFVIVAQQSLFDPTRAPPGKQTVWAYCHVPNGSTVNMTKQIEAQFERFAPGFSKCILARHTMNAMDVERYNPNYVGGDINGGVADIFQLFTRPIAQLVPYATPIKGLYMCSSATPPGGGVHGMCGYNAALSALKVCF